jgi:glycosyltransferase involved in cell wall biosynthesis
VQQPEFLASVSNLVTPTLRILVITSSFPRFPGDIAGQFVAEHADVLRAAGHKVDVLAWAEGGETSGEADWVRYSSQPRGLFFGAGGPENLEARPLRGLWAPLAVSAMFNEVLRRGQSVDLIIGHWLVPGGLIARYAAKILDKPSLVIGHSAGVHLLCKLPEPVARPLASFILDGPTSLPSEALRVKIGNLSDSRHIRILPMGFHLNSVPSASKEPEAVFMGRLVPIKNIELAIQAVELSENCQRLHILGDGPMRENLERIADPKRVTFHGILQGKEKAEILSRASVSVFPSRVEHSRFEGLPVSLLECASAGATPILGEVPGAAPLVMDSLQRPEMNARAWATSIDKLIFSETAREYAQKNTNAFTWNFLGKEWTSWISTLFEPGR